MSMAANILPFWQKRSLTSIFHCHLRVRMGMGTGDVDEEDEVFVGPVGHREKCISVGIESHLTEGSSGSSGPLLSLELGSWSPLTGDKFDQIIQEAHLLARRIGTNAGDEPAAGGSGSGSGSSATAAAAAGPNPPGENTEPFAEDPAAKLSALGRPPGPSLSPIKRETFCIRDSPLKQLPPAIQQRLLKAGGLNSPGAVRATGRSCSPIQTSQTKVALRGKVGLSCGRGLLPSRPAVPGAYPRSKTKPPPSDTTRLPPPDKGGAGQKRSPLRRPLSSAGSSEDLLSDVSVDSLNTSLPGGRVLPGPRKVGQPPAMKPLPGLRTTDRRKNTSSSSSSVSSLNSSMSMSPSGKGAFNTSLSSGVSSGKLKGPGGVSRLAGSGVVAPSKPRASSVGARAAEAARAGWPTPSAQVKRAAEPQAGPAKPNPAKKRDLAPLNLTPAKRPVQRAGSVPNARGPRRSEVPSPDSSRMIKPKKHLSASSTESLLQKAGVPAPESLQTPTAGRKSVSALPRRSTALPTPVNRRVSGIPTMTPKSIRLGQAGERTGLPGSARKISQGSPVQLKVVQRPSGLGPEPVPREADPRSAAYQPGSLAFCLEDEPGEAPTTVPAPGTPEPASQSTAARPAGHGPRDRDNPDRSTENRDAPESKRGSRKIAESSLQSQETPESSLQSQETPESSLQVQETPESSLQVQETPESSLQVQETPESSLQSQETPESNLQVQETSESSLQSQETSESSLQSQKIPESSIDGQKIPESSIDGQKIPESSIDGQITPESSTESQSTPESCTENQNTPESNKENKNSSTQQVQRTQNDAAKTPENKEVLLVDAPAPVLKPEERLLIDLSNTPDLIKTAPLKPTGGQLIDLSSPLITWSPVDKKGNTVDSPPLINLSF
ncbi:hypothetical protein ANANG_G00310400 [Anguilla anguilla]|uniref:G2 and S phase-expressed protein 1 N-terminal domain-containing protein n=1 Tax=Anguilla anguilla TaxID=7936 RepID=A0A9D3LLH5_ANGAN|nr:hypothetical protein ANANG_G00310400 [Anguilla anguilla]